MSIYKINRVSLCKIKLYPDLTILVKTHLPSMVPMSWNRDNWKPRPTEKQHLNKACDILRVVVGTEGGYLRSSWVNSVGFTELCNGLHIPPRFDWDQLSDPM